MRMGRKVMEGIKECPKGKNGKKRTGKEDWYCVSTGMERIQIEHKRSGQEPRINGGQVKYQYKNGNVDKEWTKEGVPKQGKGQKLRTRQAQTHGWEWG